MKTRSMKRRKINEEVEENLDQVLESMEEKGASCLKYEFIKKRDKKGQEKNVLLARRCSLRNIQNKESGRDSLDKLAKLEANQTIGMSFEYNPRSFEKMNLFVKDELTRSVQLLAIQKSVRVQPTEVEEIIGWLDQDRNLALVKLYVLSDTSVKTGLQKVAAYVGKPDNFREVTDQHNGRFKGKILIVKVTQEARIFIRNNA